MQDAHIANIYSRVAAALCGISNDAILVFKDFEYGVFHTRCDKIDLTQFFVDNYNNRERDGVTTKYSLDIHIPTGGCDRINAFLNYKFKSLFAFYERTASNEFIHTTHKLGAALLDAIKMKITVIRHGVVIGNIDISVKPFNYWLYLKPTKCFAMVTRPQYQLQQRLF